VLAGVVELLGCRQEGGRIGHVVGGEGADGQAVGERREVGHVVEG
jgi:hypothetical protein